METKVCSECQQEKSVSEFYFQRHRNNYTKRCKVCRRIWMQSKDYYNNSEPPEHEQLIVNTLLSKGYPASHGRDMVKYPYVDIVVFGCIRLEAKPLLPMPKRIDAKNSGYGAATTNDQRKRGMLADVVCIVFQDELYFFNPNHPAFYIDGELRKKILYNPYSQRKHLTTNRKLETEDMELARANYKMLDNALKAWRVAQTQPKTVTFPMFPIEKAS